MLNLIQARHNNQMASTRENRDLLSCLQNISLQFKPLQAVSFFCSNTKSSSSYQESDLSLRINISTSSCSNDTQFFGQFLHQLAFQREKYNDLTSLLFHRVEWKMDHVSSLKLILMGSIKQIEFEKNMFSSEVLSELLEAIGRNTRLKAITFSECEIGCTGATLLASILSKNNNRVEELQIWEDSIGSKGAEELSKMIEVNHTIRLLTILDNNSVSAAPLISAMLSRNRNLEMHVWGNSRKIVEFTPQPGTLRIYCLYHSSDLRRVVLSLGWNRTVVTLDMTGVRLKTAWARDFRGVLESNRTLKDVKLSRTGLGNKGVVYIGAGLFKNKCVEKLSLDANRFGRVGLEHVLCPLSRFSPLQNQPANNTLKSLTFGGERTKIGRGGVVAILRMLETNEAINELVISGDKSLKPNDIIRIFASLERNVTLKRFSLKGCKGVEGDSVLQAIINVLQVNPWIEEIDLSNTPLQASGKAATVYEKLRLNASPVQEHVELLANLPLSMPTCCRVFVCGPQYAGKNTLCGSIYYNMSGIRLPYMDKVRSLVEPIEQIARSTSEIKITTIQENDAKISIWNLSCNADYFGLLDQLFPGYHNLSFFLIVVSLIRTSNNRDPKTPQEIEQELVRWLKSINSCLTRLSSSQSAQIPHATIVLTHSDKMPQQPETLHPIALVIQKLREDFKEYIEIYATVFTVDARSTVNISRLVHHLRKTAKTVLQRAPLVYQLYNNELIKIIHEWRSRNSNKPVMKWNEFCELCQMKVAVLRLRSRFDNVEKVNIRRREVVRSLHNMGEIIFFEEIGFLVVDCEWFCRDVLGLITDSAKFFRVGAQRKGGRQNNGFISRKEMEEILVKAARFRIGTNFLLEANDLINMMGKLELCYEQQPAGHPSSLLLVPSILEGCNTQSQSWEFFSSECVYVGRRLECDDTRHFCLPSTFFPRLQVQLHNKLMQSVNQQGQIVYRLEKNLIYTIINGIHIRIEVGVQPYHYIDVLACSAKNTTETITLFRQLIIPSILTLCSPKISLNESIIRPNCVKYLTPQMFRNTQHVSLQHLKEILLSLPADVMYDYQHSWNPVENVLSSGSDYVRDLLSDAEFRQVLNHRYHDLHHLAVELTIPTIPHDSKEDEENETDKGVEPSMLGIAKGVEMVLNQLRSIEEEIKDLKHEIQGLRYYEQRLLAELHKKVEYMVNYHTQLEERKVPHMFYFVQLDSSHERRLVTRIVPGMRTLRLHMLCEFRREMHVVDGQLGCDLIQVDNHTVQILRPYVNGFMKLLTLTLKIGVHFVAGMGEMIPDLSREVARLLDSSTSTLYASTAVAATALGAARALGRSRNRNEVGEDHVRSARQWIIDFLKAQGIVSGTHIAERFGLWRVRYCDDGNVAWICTRHLNNNTTQISQMPL